LAIADLANFGFDAIIPRQEDSTMKVIRCRDVGVDCDFEAHGETVEDILNQCGEHAKTAHGMTEISDDLMEKVKAAIHDEGLQWRPLNWPQGWGTG
jgi:predicted small metal-binding protein